MEALRQNQFKLGRGKLPIPTNVLFMKNTIITAIAVIIIVGGAVFLITDKKNSVSDPASSSEAAQVLPSLAPEATQEAMNTGDEKQFTIIGQNYSFMPSTIRVHRGDKVTITFQDNGGFHDLVIDKLNVRTARVGQGQSGSLQFTADTVGSFEYYCSVGSHRDKGMKGTLIVE